MPDGISPDLLPPPETLSPVNLVEDLQGRDISFWFKPKKADGEWEFTFKGRQLVEDLFTRAYGRNAESLSAIEEEIKKTESDFQSGRYEKIFASLRAKIEVEELNREYLKKPMGKPIFLEPSVPPEFLETAEGNLTKILDKELANLETLLKTRLGTPRLTGNRWWRERRREVVRVAVGSLFLSLGLIGLAAGTPATASAPAMPQPPLAGEAGSAAGIRESLSHTVKSEAGKKEIPGVPRNYQEAAERAAKLTDVAASDILRILKTESDFGTNPLMKKSSGLGPAQFTKATWLWLQKDIKTVLGRDANYSNPDDAALGVALYLRESGYGSNREKAIRIYHRGLGLWQDQLGNAYFLKVNQAGAKFRNGY